MFCGSFDLERRTLCSLFLTVSKQPRGKPQLNETFLAELVSKEPASTLADALKTNGGSAVQFGIAKDFTIQCAP